IINNFENKKHLWIVLKSKVQFEKQSDVSLNYIVMHKVMFWNMPISDLDGSMYKVWADTTRKIKNGVYNKFMKISDGEIAHIRPKATTESPYMITPQGTYEKKKCFWLNSRYIMEQIEKSDK
ncbi:MAG: DNA mismatch repair protein MutH, partial [Clostridium paraputrificum]